MAVNSEPEEDEEFGDEEADPRDRWLQPVLRMLATTQRSLVGGRAQQRKNLTRVVIEEFHGGPGVSVHAYRMWKKGVLAVQHLHGITDQELAIVIYT